MTYEISCGIIVYNMIDNERKYLLVKHQNGGHYGFPKGHMEAFETRKQTAVREVKEETNLDAVIIKNYYQKVTFEPKPNVSKDVIYFLGKAYDGKLFKQDAEIKDLRYVSYEEAKQLLTYDNDKKLIKKAHAKINKLDKELSNELMQYIEQEIIPIYQTFDKAHHADHVYGVIYDSLDLAKAYNLNRNMIYAIAGFHDLGIKYGRDTHHITGANMLREDQFINKFFTKEEIEIMADAIYDHRASHGKMPRTIYGRVIAEADRQMDAKDIMRRTALYETSKHPDLTIDEQVEHCYDHMIEKYSETGYLKLTLDIGKNVKELNKLRSYIKNEAEMKKTFKQIIKKNAL